MSDRRLAIVAFHYPPDNTSTGVLRTLKFTQYLSLYGWGSDVITVPEKLYFSVDQESNDKVPQSVRLFRTWAIDIKKVISIRGIYPGFLCIPDRYWPWVFSANRQLHKLISTKQVNAVFTTYPIPSAHLIGILAKKRHPNIPWLADFRDPWVEDTMSPFRIKIEGYFEKLVMRYADRVICNTDWMKRWFLDKYPDVNPDKFVTITNGYDEDDLLNAIPAPVNEFEILYTGVISAGNRNPRPIFEAVRLALDKQWLSEQDLRLTFLGAGDYGVSEQFCNDVAAFNLQKFVQVIVDRIPYQKALGRMAGADLVLVLSEPILDTVNIESERAWSRLQVPAKVYECLGLNRPLLALVSDGAVTDVLSKTGMGRAISPKNVPEIATALRDFYDDSKNPGGDKKSDSSRIASYSRKQLSKLLAVELDNLIQ